MEEKLQGCSIVILGSWNTRILIPPWLGQYIFKKESLEILFPMDPNFPIKVSDGENYLIDINDDKLQFTPKKLDDETLAIMGKGASTILEKLPHTPITAIGINFSFLETADKINIYNSIDKETLNLVESDDYINELKEFHFLRSFELSKNLDTRILNFKIVRKIESNEIQLDFNYHKNLNNKEARKLLEPEKIINLHNYSKDFVERLTTS